MTDTMIALVICITTVLVIDHMTRYKVKKLINQLEKVRQCSNDVMFANGINYAIVQIKRML